MAVNGDTNVADRGLLRIAVVEDDRPQGEAIVQRLNIRGFSDVEIVLSAEEIARTFREFDVLLLDLNLAGADGIDVAEQVLAQQPDKWIFVLSGNRTFLTRLAKRDLQLTAVLEKPLLGAKMDEFVGKADDLARRRKHLIRQVEEVVSSLRLSAESAEIDILAAQHSLAVAKQKFQEYFLPVSRRQSTRAGLSVRRAIVVLLWTALQRLSFVPSDEVNLIAPTSGQLSVLAECIDVLRGRGITESVEDEIDEELWMAGLWPGRGRPLEGGELFGVDEIDFVDDPTAMDDVKRDEEAS